MPYEIQLDKPAGYVASAGRKGEEVSVIVREFVSSEDGDHFIERLEGWPTIIINALPSESRIEPSIVDHLLAIIRQDKTATVYVNEINIKTRITLKARDIEAGQFVYADDIADIQKLLLDEINIPDDAGILFVFSKGWRKGLFYDFKPLNGDSPQPRNYDLEMLLGQYYAYLSFQHLFKIPDDVWDKLIAQRWFPFISLKTKTIEEIISRAKLGWDVDELLERVSTELAEALPAMLKKWEGNHLFKSHFAIFKQAVERFLETDYISATAILYPRIEGLMRSYLSTSGTNIQASQKNLVTSTIDAKSDERHNYSLLLPNRFRRYLEEVYFANFDPNNPTVLSRNSVAHGVAPQEDFSLKGAVIGLLVLDQLSFYIGAQDNT